MKEWPLSLLISDYFSFLSFPLLPFKNPFTNKKECICGRRGMHGVLLIVIT